MGDTGEDEHELAGRQPTALYPIGRALRSTFHADNHDSLGHDLTGLMLHLARVEEPAAPPAPTIAAPAPPPAPAPSWLQRLMGRLAGR